MHAPEACTDTARKLKHGQSKLAAQDMYLSCCAMAVAELLSALDFASPS
jgi:hypothetical protein